MCTMSFNFYGDMAVCTGTGNCSRTYKNAESGLPVHLGLHDDFWVAIVLAACSEIGLPVIRFPDGIAPVAHDLQRWIL